MLTALSWYRGAGQARELLSKVLAAQAMHAAAARVPAVHLAAMVEGGAGNTEGSRRLLHRALAIAPAHLPSLQAPPPPSQPWILTATSGGHDRGDLYMCQHPSAPASPPPPTPPPRGGVG